MKIEVIGDIWDLSEQTKAVANSEEDIELLINSPGGDVFECFNFVNAIKSSEHKVTANIEVMAASAGAVIALACDEVNVDSNSIVMLHNCWTLACGNAKDLKQEAEAMDTIDYVLHNIITEECKDAEALIARINDGDVWLTAEECKELFNHVNVVKKERCKMAACADFMEALKTREAKLNQLQAKVDELEAKIAEPQPEPAESYVVTDKLKKLLAVELE